MTSITSVGVQIRKLSTQQHRAYNGNILWSSQKGFTAPTYRCVNVFDLPHPEGELTLVACASVTITSGKIRGCHDTHRMRNTFLGTADIVNYKTADRNVDGQETPSH